MKFAGYTEIKTQSGRPLFVKKELYPVFEKIRKEYQSDYHMTTVMRTLATLNSDALRGKIENPGGDGRAITFGHISMKYMLFSGAVLIHLLAIRKPKIQSSNILCTVKYDVALDRWRPKISKMRSLALAEKWKSEDKQAHYAAVAGKFSEGVSAAANRLPEHIIGGYEKAHYLTRHDRGDQYSLFWIEKGAHKSASAAESLASLMQQSAINALPVNWLIHGEGVHTFKNSAKLMNTAPLESAPILKTNANVNKAQHQSVYFSNPASSDSEASLKALCERAGLTFAGMNTSHRDLRRWSTLKNVGRELAKPVAIGLAAGGIEASDLGLKTLGAGGFDKTVTHTLDALSTGNYLGAAIGAVGAGWLVISAVSKRKAIGATVKCTFGRGNERWYSKDEALLV